jgi:hypothetical protein
MVEDDPTTTIIERKARRAMTRKLAIMSVVFSSKSEGTYWADENGHRCHDFE